MDLLYKCNCGIRHIVIKTNSTSIYGLGFLKELVRNCATHYIHMYGTIEALTDKYQKKKERENERKKVKETEKKEMLHKMHSSCHFSMNWTSRHVPSLLIRIVVRSRKHHYIVRNCILILVLLAKNFRLRR